MPPGVSPAVPFSIEKMLPFSSLAGQPAVAATSRRVRRRASVEQGRALETLGHAVEYLVDSRMFMLGEHNRAAETEAVQILMRLSRTVFADCPEVVPLRVRLSRLARLRLR